MIFVTFESSGTKDSVTKTCRGGEDLAGVHASQIDIKNVMLFVTFESS